MSVLQSPAVVSPQPPAGRTRSRARSVLVAAVSAFVVLAALVYVLVPAGVSVRLTAYEVSGPQPYDHEALPEYSPAALHLIESTAHRPTETVYGYVQHRGVLISHVVLTVAGNEHRTKGQLATIRMSGNGTYRVVLHLTPGIYRFTLSLTVHRRTRTVAVNRTLKDGHYYCVRGVVQNSGIVTFLPVTAY